MFHVKHYIIFLIRNNITITQYLKILSIQSKFFLKFKNK